MHVTTIATAYKARLSVAVMQVVFDLHMALQYHAA